MIRLGFAQKLALANFITAEYAKRGKTDLEFAKDAEEELGIHMNDNHVAGVRSALGIPSTKEVLEARSTTTIIERLEAAEAMIGKLIRRIDDLERFRKNLES